MNLAVQDVKSSELMQSAATFPSYHGAIHRPSETNMGGALAGRFRSLLILLICAFLPFQLIGVPVGTTVFDISNIILVILVSTVIIGNKNTQKNAVYFLYLAFFCIVHLYIFSYNDTNISRFLSAFLWIGSYAIIFIRRKDIGIPTKQAYVVILWVTAALFLMILFELFVEGVPRPAGFMAEPSPAGLVLLAASAGLILASRKSSSTFEKFSMLIVALIFGYVSFALRSTHIISFAFSLLVVTAFSRAFDVRLTAVGGLIFVFIFMVVLQDQHFQERLDLGSGNSNLSVLSWLQGFDQMMESIRSFPVFGAGFGSTGYFHFDSYNSLMLFDLGIGDLNRYDAYSGLFRMIIELGPVFSILFLISILGRLIGLWNNTGLGVLPVCNESKYQIFLFTFAFTLIAGIMLKEPTWSRSQVAVAVLLFYVVPLNAYKAKPQSFGQNG